MRAIQVRQQGPSYVAAGHCKVVFRLATIGVLLSTSPASRGTRISSAAVRTSTRRTTRTTCVQCGLSKDSFL